MTKRKLRDKVGNSYKLTNGKFKYTHHKFRREKFIFYLQKGPFVRDLTVFKYLKYKPSSAICSRQIILKLVKHSKFMFFKGLY